MVSYAALTFTAVFLLSLVTAPLRAVPGLGSLVEVLDGTVKDFLPVVMVVWLVVSDLRAWGEDTWLGKLLGIVTTPVSWVTRLFKTDP